MYRFRVVLIAAVGFGGVLVVPAADAAEGTPCTGTYPVTISPGVNNTGCSTT